MNHPHFDLHTITSPSALPARADGPGDIDPSIGALLARTADCLAALLQGPTATVGLNESRYNVLDALRGMPGVTSTQTDLAARLLQSESNLSTLLDRMRSDGLISRTRSDRDRRKSLIGLTPAGREALARGDLVRTAATAKILKGLAGAQAAGLRQALQLLLARCELELGIAGRSGAGGESQRGESPSRESRPVHLYSESLTG